MNTCSNCKFWSSTTKVLPSTHGTCVKLSCKGVNYSLPLHIAAPVPPDIASSTFVITRENFGCTIWEHAEVEL